MNDSRVQDLQLVRDAAQAIETGLTERAQPQEQTALDVARVRAALDEILSGLAPKESGEPLRLLLDDSDDMEPRRRRPARKSGKKSRRRR